MSLPDQELNLVLQLVALIGIVSVVVVKMTKFCGISLGDILPYRCGSLIRNTRAGRLVDLYSTFYKGHVVGESRIVSIAFGAFSRRG